MAETNERKNKPIEVELSIPSDTESEIRDSIIEVLSKTRFDKISFPLSSYRNLFDENLDSDDPRTMTVGYIKRFNSKTNKFSVVIYNGVRDTVDTFGDLLITPVFTQYDGKFGTIIKLIITPDYSKDK